jgi:NADH-quinone oxidoreductase subunit H
MIRWTLPRFRYDQIMNLCWRYMLPLSLANIFVTGAVLLWIGG